MTLPSWPPPGLWICGRCAYRAPLPSRGQRCSRCPPLASFDHIPTALHHGINIPNIQSCNTLTSPTTDRPTAYCPYRLRPGSYLHWKRLTPSFPPQEWVSEIAWAGLWVSAFACWNFQNRGPDYGCPRSLEHQRWAELRVSAVASWALPIGRSKQSSCVNTRPDP